ncbi:MAG: hypothetical protein HOP33_17495, partial [Verrucomicrobia bacterium]|nr:hypothetical protein [Verrucomicrobiota bacterium]
MNGFDFMNSVPCFIEISQDSLRVQHGVTGRELLLERLSNGKLTPACREQVITGLKALLKRPAWQPRLRAWCAIGARGVLLRRLTIPPGGKNELQQMLRLQIESEFPLPPDELAWGYLRRDEIARSGTDGRQEL